jgi:ectoine hydroxylase-related dioxygenase (phytanoyl-CoA dioxygenase family)
MLRARLATAIPEVLPLVAVQCTYFNKSPGRNWLVAYHQDRSIPIASSVDSETWPGWSQKEGTSFVHGTNELLAQMLAVRLHVDDCTADNGPLRVIPDSHRVGTLPPEVVAAVRDTTDDQELLVDKGGIIAI